MDRLLATLVIVLATFTLEIEAVKSSNRTDRCYKPCRVKSTPVCGNDGRNYTTGCHLSVARCKARRFGQLIYPVNTGYCQSSKPVSQCNLNCTQYKAPVCASDKKTYKNLCLYKRAKCEARKRQDPPLAIVNKKGPCIKKASSCRPFSDCPEVKRPVCGSDNKTYLNICYLKGKSCRLKRAAKGRKYKKLTLKYCGACGRGKRCAAAWTQKCPEVKFCDQLLRAAVRYAETKKASESNSLSKNGNNKRVPRLPKKNTKKKSSKKTNMKKPKTKKTSTKKTNSKKTSLKKTSIQKLLKKTNPKTSKKQNPNTNKPSSKVSKKPEKIIPKEAFQVCGSDGVTYPSLCHLQVEQCNKINRCQRLQMKHKGACKKQPRRRS